MKGRLNHYHDLLLKWQKTINLVSPATIDNAWERHFEDSVQLLKYLPKQTKKICDIGSGAGFPGLAIAIENPDIHVTLIESDVRKCAFLQTVSRETSCDNVTVINDRIENVIDDVKVDIVTSRALASLRQLINYTASQWMDNSDFKMILPKGKNYKDEIDEALKNYHFDVGVHESKTQKDARILIVGNITKK